MLNLLVAAIAVILVQPQPQPAARLRVLGTAQDGGVPHAACTCVNCAAATADAGRRRLVASLAIITRGGEAEEGSTRVYLVDATPDLREQLVMIRDVRPARPAGVDRAPVDGVFLTHAHLGHYTGLAFFGFEAVNTKELPVYCTARLAGFLRDNGPWSQLDRLRNIDLRETTPGEGVSLPGGVTVTPVVVPHRDEFSDTVGYRIAGPGRVVLYVPDTEPWRTWKAPLPEPLSIFEGVDVAILDATFFSPEELPGRHASSIGHPLMTETMDLLGERVRAGTLRVYFTHLNHSNPALDPGSEAAKEVERRGFRVLRDGEELAL